MLGEAIDRESTQAPGVSASAADVCYSDDPRDIGWVRQNVPCQAACPAQTYVPGYIRALSEGRYGKAYEINREANVLPGVLGRICSRPCESACRHGWAGNGEPVAICHLKRGAHDFKPASHRITENLYAPTGKRVAIIGAGPAGVAAAHDLSLLGHDVVIFEREERPGGMLRYGIPEFRLPRDLLEIELHNALRLGVALRTGVAIGNGKGERRLSSVMSEFDAVLLATGCMKATPLPLRAKPGDAGAASSAGADAGRSLRDVEYGLDFLLALHRGEQRRVGRRVAVVGAGFTALDCARVARRLGAQEVTIHIRTTEDYIPVAADEIFEAKREGIRLQGLRTPVDLVTDDAGRLTGVTFVQNRLGAWREGGRRQALAIEGSEFFEPCDTLIVAIGQQTVTDFVDQRLELGRNGSVRLGASGMTSVNGLFAAGDFVRGASTVIEAIGHGREIADRIDGWLVGRRRRQVVRIEPIAGPLRDHAFDFIPRQDMPTLPLERRFKGQGEEVECGLGKEVAGEEARRCYLCDLRYQIDVDRCTYCRACIEVAPRNCIKLVKEIERAADGSYGKLIETKVWSEVGAIVIDNNECIRCGACFKACPVQCISITRNSLCTVDSEP